MQNGNEGSRASDSEAPPKERLVDRARRFAVRAHAEIDHRRKYSDDPYSVHLEAVAGMVGEVTEDPEVIAAAWLHDTVEDTKVELRDIEREFGARVATLVENLTDVSRRGQGNRAARRAIDRGHSARARPEAKTIKLADVIDNLRSIVPHDPGFGRVYVTEQELLLPLLREGDPVLFERARRVLEESRRRLG